MLDRERSKLADQLSMLEIARASGPVNPTPSQLGARVTTASTTAEKIALFRSLFRGREEVFPRRWENPKSGKSGYSPACRHEWVRGVCGKPQVKCGECPNQAFVPFDDDVIRSHLTGKAAGNAAGFHRRGLSDAAGRDMLVPRGGFRQEVLEAGRRRVPRYGARKRRPRRDRTLALRQRRSCVDLLRGTRAGGVMRGGSGRSWSRRRWIAVPTSASIRMTGFSRARTRCRRGGSAI